MQRLEQETIDALVLVEGIAIIHINTKYTTGSFSSKDITKKIEKQTLLMTQQIKVSNIKNKIMNCFQLKVTHRTYN